MWKLVTLFHRTQRAVFVFERCFKMPSIKFEIWCSCGNGLCNQTREVEGGVSVEPCEKCLDAAKEEGHTDGYNERDKEE